MYHVEWKYYSVRNIYRKRKSMFRTRQLFWESQLLFSEFFCEWEYGFPEIPMTIERITLFEVQQKTCSQKGYIKANITGKMECLKKLVLGIESQQAFDCYDSCTWNCCATGHTRKTHCSFTSRYAWLRKCPSYYPKETYQKSRWYLGSRCHHFRKMVLPFGWW